MATTKTTLKLKTGETAYTSLTPADVRGYMSKGIGTGAIPGWLEDGSNNKTHDIYIGVHAIVYVWQN